MSGTTPFDLWLAGWRSAAALATAGWRTAETLAAAAEVIGRRSGTIEAALRDPFAADTRELTLMVTEKGDAFSRAGLLAWRDAWALQTAWATTVWQLGTLAAGGQVPSAAQASAAWTRSVDLLGRAARAGTAALGPIHRTATANARRLRR